MLDRTYGLRLVVFTLAVVCIAVPASMAQLQTCEWDPIFGNPGVDGPVDTMLVWDPDDTGPEATFLYVGGRFTTAGGSPANQIARWSSTGGWSAMADGFDKQVAALAVFNDGTGEALYAGGQFDFSGSRPIKYIAKWTGSNWVSLNLNSNLSGGTDTTQIWDMAPFDDGTGMALYIAGDFDFTNGRGERIRGVAKWNKSQNEWDPLISSTNLGLAGPAYTLVAFDDGNGEALYVGGEFTSAGGGSASNVAKWDGENWSGLGNGCAGRVNTLAVSDLGTGQDALFAGGRFRSAGTVSASRIAKWDGTQWSALGPGLDNWVMSMSEFFDGTSTGLYVGGFFVRTGDNATVLNRIAKWDGSSWFSIFQGVGDTTRDAVLAMPVFEDYIGDNLFVGGQFTVAGGHVSNYVARLGCWVDCNSNGIADSCDISCDNPGCEEVEGCGGSEDCEPNGIPDECDCAAEPGNNDGDSMSNCEEWCCRNDATGTMTLEATSTGPIAQGDLVDVTLSVDCIPEEVVGYQAFVEWDSRVLTLLRADYYSGDLFDVELIVIPLVPGRARISAGVNPQIGQPPVAINTYAHQATLTFRSTGECVGPTPVRFTPNHAPPTRFGGTQDNEVLVDLVDTRDISGDGPPCPDVPCCINEACQMLSWLNCVNAGGDPQQDTQCRPGMCEPSDEACCMPDGSCTNRPAQGCLDAGGVPQGEGTECATTTCPEPSQACCLPDHSCIYVPPSQCRSQNGEPQGAGTTCATVDCNGGTGTAPTPNKADSCINHGSICGTFCAEVWTEAAGSQGTEWREDGVVQLVVQSSTAVSAPVDVPNVTCNGAAYGGSVTATATGANEVTLDFAPALTNKACCMIDWPGKPTIYVRTLKGDTNRDALVTTTDTSLIKAQYQKAVDSGPVPVRLQHGLRDHDFGLVADQSVLYQNTAPACP